jgi:hypothetical protein
MAIQVSRFPSPMPPYISVLDIDPIIRKLYSEIALECTLHRECLKSDTHFALKLQISEDEVSSWISLLAMAGRIDITYFLGHRKINIF